MSNIAARPLWSVLSVTAGLPGLLLVLTNFVLPGRADNPGGDVSTTESAEDLEEELHEFDAETVILICGCMFIALAMGYALHKYKFNYLPHSTAAMLLGVVVGGVALGIQEATNSTGESEFNELSVLTFSSEFFFYVLLPPIIFDAGYHFEKKRFFRNFSTIILFAVVGTILSTFVVGFTVYGFAVAGVIENVDATSPLEALLFGSLISAVDPVATLSIMGNPELKFVDLRLCWLVCNHQQHSIA